MEAEEPGIAEEIVGVVRRALEGLGFATDKVPTVPRGLVVPGRAADALFDRAAVDLADEAIGLTLAQRIQIGSLGTIDYALCTAATLREALQRVTQYYGVATQRARLDLVEDGKLARLQFSRLPNIAHSRYWIEFALGMISMRIRQTLGQERLAFSRVAFRHPAPVRRDAHDAFFGTRVAFDAAEDCVVFAADLLEQHLHTASATLALVLERRMQELEPAMAPVDPIVDRIRRMLVTMLDAGVTDLPALASRLQMSKRTLQRVLGEHATSHRILLDELRRHRAAELLDQGLRVVDVAHRLGFSDASAFFRAYRRWTGTSPSATRAELLAPIDSGRGSGTGTAPR